MELVEKWHFSGDWVHLVLSLTESGYLRIGAPYYGWKIWPEAELVQKIESLAEAGDMESALALLGPSMFEI